MEQEPLRIGRVARATERALGLSLSGEVAIYMEGRDLDRFSQKRPNDYLSYIQEIGAILKNPDFVSFNAEEERFVYLKNYYKNGTFTPVFVFIHKKGTPRRFFFQKMEFGSKQPLPEELSRLSFRRPNPKKDPEKD